MKADAIKAAYRRYAPVYDMLFGTVFQPGRRRVVDMVNTAPGQRILEVGVGTGLVLPCYRADARVIGIDLSPDMLARARTRASTLANVEAVLEMDAQAMAFPNDSFDAVVAMYVVSVVPDPARLLAEMSRVCKPDGDIVVVNHFASDHRLLRGAERLMAPLSSWVGFRSDYSLEQLRAAAALEVRDSQPVNALGYWRIVRFRNRPAQGAFRGAREPIARPIGDNPAPGVARI